MRAQGLDLRRIAILSIVGALAIAAGLWSSGYPGTPAVAAGPPPTQITLGLDMQTVATDPGTYDIYDLPAFEACVDVDTSVNNGTFYVDLFVLNTSDLIAFVAEFEFSTGGVMQVSDTDVEKFFGTSPDVVNLSQSTPNDGGTFGRYEAEGLDNGTPNTGSGVLVRLELQASTPPTGGAVLDFDIDSRSGHGVTLTDDSAANPGDSNSDSFFDGNIINPQGTIAVDRPDGDSDGVSNDCDNCPSAPNAGQANNDGDSQGDACDPDDDNDGIPDGADNCPNVYNPSQDAGACGDDDSDGVPNGLDNCPAISNPLQENNEGDAQGDVCDLDDDNDGVQDVDDNCPYVSNTSQEDWNWDSIGDACQNSDNDSHLDAVDNCPADFNEDQTDGDSDGLGNACDNCPSVPNAGQEDVNSNGTGDACEDSDSDLYSDAQEMYMDTLPLVACPATGVVTDGAGYANDEYPDAWPPDLNDDQVINLPDILFMAPPVFFSIAPGPPYNARADLNGDGVINLADILNMAPPVFFSTCTP